MDQIYPDEGLLELLTRCVTPGLVWHLFVNNVTPSLSDPLVLYTEAAWAGYSPQTVLAAAFTFQNVVAHVGSVQAPNIVFLNTSGSAQQAYGYYITDIGNTILIAAARFDLAPVSIPDGGNLPVTPIHGDFSGLSS